MVQPLWVQPPWAAADGGRGIPGPFGTPLERPETRELLLYWAGMARGRPLPNFSEFQPAEITPLWPALFVYEAQRGGEDYKVCHRGGAWDAVFGRQPPGSLLSEAPQGLFVMRMRHLFDTVRVAKAPIVAYHNGGGPQGPWREETLCCPLTVHGSEADLLLGVTTLGRR